MTKREQELTAALEAIQALLIDWNTGEQTLKGFQSIGRGLRDVPKPGVILDYDGTLTGRMAVRDPATSNPPRHDNGMLKSIPMTVEGEEFAKENRDKDIYE